MKLFLTLIIIFILAIIGAAVYVWSGVYNVAASEPHYGITVWFLENVRKRSIEVRSEGIRLPPYKDPKFMDIGARHYDAMCRVCHGAPGYSRSEIAQGLNPQPPDLTSQHMQALSDVQLYWIVKNGIKMTGMPAFGSTHGEEELLGLLAFVRRLPDVKPDEYTAIIEAAVPHEEGEEHHRRSPSKNEGKAPAHSEHHH